MHMLLAEGLGVFLAEKFVEMFACIGQFVGARHHERIVGNVDDTLQMGHLGSIDGGAYYIAHEQQL